MFEVFDKKYEGKVDAHFIGDMLRALNLAPTNAECEKRGQTPKPGFKHCLFNFFLILRFYIFNVKKKEAKQFRLKNS